MSIEFLPPDVDELTPKITVIGVGGAGGNAIANMIRAEVQGVDFLVANTDAQALKQSSAANRIQLEDHHASGVNAYSGADAAKRGRRATKTIGHPESSDICEGQPLDRQTEQL